MAMRKVPCRRGASTMVVAGLVLGLAVAQVYPAAAKDEVDIEKVVELLTEAFRTGNYDMVTPYLAKDITVTAVGYAPPIEGSDNLLRSYRIQHEQLKGAEMVREDTRIAREGKVAWVTYRWRYAANVEGEIFGYQGHTTLVLVKRRRKWMIVHNHTSPIPSPPEEGPAS